MGGVVFYIGVGQGLTGSVCRRREGAVYTVRVEDGTRVRVSLEPSILSAPRTLRRVRAGGMFTRTHTRTHTHSLTCMFIRARAHTHTHAQGPNPTIHLPMTKSIDCNE